MVKLNYLKAFLFSVGLIFFMVTSISAAENLYTEYSQGERQVFLSKGHPKSMGIDLRIDYPKGWKRKEGIRPHVVQMFTGYNSGVIVNSTLTISNILDHAKNALSDNELELVQNIKSPKESEYFFKEIFSKQNLFHMASAMGYENIRNFKSKNITVDRWPGAMFEFTGEGKRLDMSFTVYNQYYLFVYKHYAIHFACNIAKKPSESEEIFRNNINTFSPLFHLMAINIVILN